MFFVAIIAAIVVSAAISIALQPKVPGPKPSALSDFDVPTAEEGRPYVVIFGKVTVRGPNVAWYGALRTKKIKSKSKKKG